MGKDNWFPLIYRIGRIVFWILGILFAWFAFPSIDFLSFLLVGILCGDFVTLIFTLVFSYAWFQMSAKADVTEHELDELGTGGIRQVARQVCFGMYLNLLPEFLGGAFGAGAGLLVHSWLGWEIGGTFLVFTLVLTDFGRGDARSSCSACSCAWYSL